jgi:hypothetical protein
MYCYCQDENDIRLGQNYAHRIFHEIGASRAFVAVVTARYGTTPWPCLEVCFCFTFLLYFIIILFIV